MRWIVVAYAFGDGAQSDEYGARMWSQEFTTKKAAEAAAAFFNGNNNITASVIQDGDAQ